MMILFIADLLAFMAADIPKRPSHWVYKIPGGGFCALIRFGTRDER